MSDTNGLTRIDAVALRRFLDGENAIVREHTRAILARPEFAKGDANPPAEEYRERVMEWARDAQAQHPEGIVLGVTHEAPLAAALLLGSGGGLAAFHTTHLPHLGCVRLHPGPPGVVDLPAMARSC